MPGTVHGKVNYINRQRPCQLLSLSRRNRNLPFRTLESYKGLGSAAHEKSWVRELAKLANVSLGTVDRALDGRKEVSEKTRHRILKIAEKHGYTPNLTARALSVGRPNIRIGVCVPQEIRYFYDQIREGISNEAQRFRHVGVDVVSVP